MHSPLVIVLAGVQDPGNVGTILRSAEAFGATGAVATRGTADPWSPKALRASAGSALRLPVLRGIAVPVLLAQLQDASGEDCGRERPHVKTRRSNRCRFARDSARASGDFYRQ